MMRVLLPAALVMSFFILLPARAEEARSEPADALRPERPGGIQKMQEAAGAPARAASEAQKEMGRGDFWLMMRRHDLAIRHFRKAMELDPKLVAARFRYAFCLFKRGQHDEAAAELGKTLEIDPRFIPAYQGLGELHLSRKELDKAVSVLTRGVAVAPEDAKLLLTLGKALRQRGEAAAEGPNQDKAKALEVLERAEKHAPAQSPLASLVKRELVLLRFGKMGEKLHEARDLLAKGEGEPALKLLDEVVAQHPSVAEAHYLRGLALSSPRLNRVDEAIAAYKKAGAMREALLAIGQLHYEKGEMEDAEEWMKKAIGADERYQEAHYALGLVYKELGEYDRAIAAWRKAVALGPKTKFGAWAGTKLQLLTGNIRGLEEGEVLDPAAERDLGQKLMEGAIRRFGLLEDEQLQARLDRIFRKLIAVSDRGAENLRYELRLVKNRSVNAITFPGGKILLFKGMLDLIRKECGDSDDVYAAVIGHELAHAALRHGVTKAKIITARGAAPTTNFSSLSTLRSFLMGFSRANEFEADQYGALYAYRAGYNPAAGLTLQWKMLARREIPSGLGHPQHRDRIERLREYLLSLRAKTRSFKLGLKALDKQDYGRAIQHFESYLGVFPNSLAGRNNLALAMHKKALLRIPAGAFKKSSDIDPNARIPVITVRAAEMKSVGGLARPAPIIDKPLLREAVAELEMALRLDPSYVSAHVNLGAALLDLGGELEMAIGHLKTATRLDPENVAAKNNLAVAYLESGQEKKGLALLKKLTRGEGASPDAFFNLAIAYERAGDKKKAARAFARYLETDKDSGWAKIARERLAALQ
jgi:predicted Zn-dependent protease